MFSFQFLFNQRAVQHQSFHRFFFHCFCSNYYQLSDHDVLFSLTKTPLTSRLRDYSSVRQTTGFFSYCFD